MTVCRSRTVALDEYLRRKNGISSLHGPLPHVFGSRRRTLIDGDWIEWAHPKCSWCGKLKP